MKIPHFYYRSSSSGTYVSPIKIHDLTTSRFCLIFDKIKFFYDGGKEKKQQHRKLLDGKANIHFELYWRHICVPNATLLRVTFRIYNKNEEKKTYINYRRHKNPTAVRFSLHLRTINILFSTSSSSIFIQFRNLFFNSNNREKKQQRKHQLYRGS